MKKGRKDAEKPLRARRGDKAPRSGGKAYLAAGCSSAGFWRSGPR
jgi:hypothetical protein